MEPSVTLFLAAIIAGFGFAIGQSIWSTLIGIVRK